MSIKIMSAVFENETLAPTERLILLSLADHADDAGRCYPSIGRLCKRTGLRERAVQTNLKALSQKGYVSIVPNGGPGGTNLFFVRATPAADAPPQEMRPRSRCTTPPQQMRQTPAADAPEPSGTVIEPSTTAREAQPAVVAAARDSRREEVLSLMGCSAAGITPEGRFTGTTNDQVEIAKWDGLGLSRSEQDGVIRDMLAKQRNRSPGFMPNRWSWFTAGMNELARAKTARPAAGTPSAPAETPEQRRARRRKMIGG